MAVEFECLKCHNNWKQNAKPVVCPKCKHLLIKWKNFEEWAKEQEKYEI